MCIVSNRIDLSCNCWTSSKHFVSNIRAQNVASISFSSINFAFYFSLNYASQRKMSLNWHWWISCNVLYTSVSIFSFHAAATHFTINEQMKSQSTKTEYPIYNSWHFMFMITPYTTTTNNTDDDISDSNHDEDEQKKQKKKKIYRMKCDSDHLTKRHLIHRMIQTIYLKTKTKHKKKITEREKTTSNEMKKNGCHLLTLI